MLDAVLSPVGTELLHEFVVNSEKQESRRPLADEKRVFLPAGDFESEGGGDGTESEPKEGIGRELGGMFFDGAGDNAFAVVLARGGGTGCGRIHCE